jgi:hypothetical protein
MGVEEATTGGRSSPSRCETALPEQISSDGLPFSPDRTEHSQAPRPHAMSSAHLPSRDPDDVAGERTVTPPQEYRHDEW